MLNPYWRDKIASAAGAAEQAIAGEAMGGQQQDMGGGEEEMMAAKLEEDIQIAEELMQTDLPLETKVQILEEQEVEPEVIEEVIQGETVDTVAAYYGVNPSWLHDKVAMTLNTGRLYSQARKAALGSKGVAGAEAQLGRIADLARKKARRALKASSAALGVRTPAKHQTRFNTLYDAMRYQQVGPGGGVPIPRMRAEVAADMLQRGVRVNNPGKLYGHLGSWANMKALHDRAAFPEALRAMGNTDAATEALKLFKAHPVLF